jgi:hypothetical protein
MESGALRSNRPSRTPSRRVTNSWRAPLRRAFGHSARDTTDDLPELLEELAEYYLSVDRAEDAITAAGRAVMMTPSAAGQPDALRRRCRTAG